MVHAQVCVHVVDVLLCVLLLFPVVVVVAVVVGGNVPHWQVE